MQRWDWRFRIRQYIYCYLQILLIAQDYENLEYMTRKLIDEYELWGLKLNVKKTKYMAIEDITRLTTRRSEADNKSRKLTLRLLMSYIYIYMEHPFLMFLDHTQPRSTVGRTPLDE